MKRSALQMMRGSAAALALLACGAFARAEESLDEVKARLENRWEPWSGCGPGSWYQTKSKTLNGTTASEFEMRQTLVARDAKEFTIETRTVKRTKDANGNEVVELGEPQSSTSPFSKSTTCENLKDLRQEDVDVAGEKLSCRVVELEYVTKYPKPFMGKTESRSKMTLWLSTEVKELGGIVKSEGDSDKQPLLGTQSHDMQLMQRGKEVKIGRVTLNCSVYRYGNVSGREEQTSRGEFWMSADAPFCYVKSSMQMHIDTGGTKMRATSESELTGIELVKLKTD